MQNENARDLMPYEFWGRRSKFKTTFKSTYIQLSLVINVPVQWVSRVVDTRKEAIQLELIHDRQEQLSAWRTLQSTA